MLILDVDPQGSAAAWRSLRDDDTIAVQSGRPDEVEKLLRRACSANFDLVLIDNAPGKNSSVSRVAGMSDLSIILARPSPFDLLIGRDWVKAFEGRKFVMVIAVAPPPRQGQDSPLVRDARHVLRGLGGRVWRRQLTARHAVVQCTGLGRTVIEADPFSPAAQEHSRLWNGLVNEQLGSSKMKRSMTDKLDGLSDVARPAAGDLDRIAPEDDETAQIRYRTTISTRQVLRRIALDEQSSVQALLTEAINALLINRRRDPSA